MTIAVTHSTVATLPDEPGAEINKAQWNANHSLTGTADVAQGGTGASDAATARTNLGVPAGSGTSTGTNTGDQTITLTGAVTGSGTGSFATTLTGPYSATTFTAGAVLIGNGTSAIQTDATKLFFDVTNHRLGVGNNAPTYPLDVTGTARFATMLASRTSGIAQFEATTSGDALYLRTANTTIGTAGDIVGFPGNATSGTAGNVLFNGGTATTGVGGALIFGGGAASGAGGQGGDVVFAAGSGLFLNGFIRFQDSAFTDVMLIDDAGVLNFGTYTAGVVAPTGYITIKDIGGTTRRLLVG